MKIGLFDLYTSGHHLEYANRIKHGLDKISNHEIKFITLTKTEYQESYFSSEEIKFIDSPDSSPIENRDSGFTDISDSIIEGFFSDHPDKYDVIHFLYIDDILGPICRHANGKTKIIGDLTGPFLTRWVISRKKYLHPLFLGLLQSPLRHLVDRLVPKKPDHEAFWRDLLLYRCLNRKVFDSLLVHSLEAKSYVDLLDPKHNTMVEFIPHPGPDVSLKTLTQKQARKELDLPNSTPIILFFGTLRSDKGIDILLSALRQYDGPEFTMFIAGPLIPENPIGRKEIQKTIQDSNLDIRTDLSYIEDSEPYYCAADGIVMPYRWSFGKENMSMILQEASAYQRPVITPDFGVLGRLTKEHNLGMTFKQGSSSHLSDTIAEFVQRQPLNMERNLQNYSRNNTYEKVASEILKSYNS